MTDYATEFATNGFAVLRGVFAPSELAEPLEALTAWHARRASNTNDGLLYIYTHEQAAEAYERRFWRPIAERLRTIASDVLGRTPLEIGRQLIGSRGDPVGSKPHFDPHIDSVTLALKQSTDGGNPVFPRFDLLAGVYLTDAPDESDGGLWVWPGSHRLAEATLRGSGTPCERLTHLWDEVNPRLAEPHCIRGNAGDVLLIHPYLVHASGRNTNPHLAGRMYLRFSGKAADAANSVLPQELRECVLRRERSVFTLNESARGTRLLHKYARFKLGDVAVREELLTQLAKFVAGALDSPAEPDEWALATASTNDLAHDFAAHLARAWGLKVPLAVLDVSTPASLGTDYTHCTQEERACIARGFFEDIGPIRQRAVVIVDDMITTGTALGTLVQFLAERGVEPAAVYPFALVRSYFAEPGHERDLVDAEIARFTPEEIAAIINHPRHYATSGTMWRHLANCTESRRDAVIAALLPDRRMRLAASAAKYLGEAAGPLLAAVQEVAHAG